MNRATKRERMRRVRRASRWLWQILDEQMFCHMIHRAKFGIAKAWRYGR
jgi:hypothetical protein